MATPKLKDLVAPGMTATFASTNLVTRVGIEPAQMPADATQYRYSPMQNAQSLFPSRSRKYEKYIFGARSPGAPSSVPPSASALA